MSPPALIPEERIHWKVVFRVLAICYFVPGLVAAALLAAGLQEAIVQHLGRHCEPQPGPATRKPSSRDLGQRR